MIGFLSALRAIARIARLESTFGPRLTEQAACRTCGIKPLESNPAAVLLMSAKQAVG